VTEGAWQVEDGFFGALLGAVLGIIAPASPPFCFILLTVLLGTIVVLVNRAGTVAGRRRDTLVASVLLLTVLGSIGLCLIGQFKWEYGLWLAGPICAWVVIKF
jgi:hypothetical protein